MFIFQDKTHFRKMKILFYIFTSLLFWKVTNQTCYTQDVREPITCCNSILREICHGLIDLHVIRESILNSKSIFLYVFDSNVTHVQNYVFEYYTSSRITD